MAGLSILLGAGVLPHAWHTLNTDFPNYYLTARLSHESVDSTRIYEWLWIQRQKDHRDIDQSVVGMISAHAILHVDCQSVCITATASCETLLDNYQFCLACIHRGPATPHDIFPIASLGSADDAQCALTEKSALRPVLRASSI